jgi:hypothetical protein
MTQPDPQPNSQPTPIPEVFEREIEAIDVDELDKENLGWTKSYVAGLRERLATEQAAASPDFVMISYLKKEIATYQELLDRTGG